MNRYCTIPKLFGLRHWWEVKFGVACKQHDHDYVHQRITRQRADCKYFAYMVNKGYPLLGIVTYFFLRALGWLYWHDLIGGNNTKKVIR